MSPRQTGFLSILRRWWAVILLTAGAGGLIAYVYGSRVESTYEAVALMEVVPPPEPIGAVQTAGEHTPTYAELVRSRDVLEATRTELGLSLTLAQLRDDVRAEAERATRLLTIRVRSGDPNEAAAIANKLAQKLRTVVGAAAPRPEEGGSAPSSNEPVPTLRVAEPAVDVTRVRPRVALSMEFGALAGLFGGLAFIFLVESFGRTVRSENDLAELAPFAFLGSVSGGRLSRNGRPFSLAVGAGSNGTDAYRKLVARLASANDGQPPRAVLVAGIQGREGSGLVALKLAAALAGPGQRVVLADFGGAGELMRLFKRGRRARAGQLPERGTPLRRGTTVLDSFRLGSGIQLVLALPRRPPPRVLDLDEAKQLLELLRGHADIVVLHAAPPGRAPATLAWASLVDLTLLVARRERTRRRSVSAALQGLEVVGANAVGTVLHAGRHA
jgi:polysaccharide biosynthesis transport protein